MIFENRAFFTFCSSKVWPIFLFELWFFLKKNWKVLRFGTFGAQVLFLQTKMEFLNKQKGHTFEIEREKKWWKSIFWFKKNFFFSIFSPSIFQNYFSWTQRKREVAKDDKRQHTVSPCWAPGENPRKRVNRLPPGTSGGKFFLAFFWPVLLLFWSVGSF